MRVYEYLSSVSDEDIRVVLQEEFDMDDESVDRLLAKKLPIINSIRVKEDIVKLRLQREVSLDEVERWDVCGLLESGEEIGIDTAPWGLVNHLEVEAPSILTDAEIAAFLLHELTFFGSDEEKREMLMNLHDSLEQLEEFEELNPGIRISSQVREAMEKDPELKKYIEGLTFDDVKGKGRRIKDD